jgi:hypothetical protein
MARHPTGLGGGEPNDWQAGVARCDDTGNEDCNEIWRSGDNWNDTNCDGSKPCICGVCPSNARNPTMYFADATNKATAEFNCIIGGCHLASLHSEADSGLLDTMIDDNGGGSTWIGRQRPRPRLRMLALPMQTVATRTPSRSTTTTATTTTTTTAATTTTATTTTTTWIIASIVSMLLAFVLGSC